jgi:hypothetical protein
MSVGRNVVGIKLVLACANSHANNIEKKLKYHVKINRIPLLSHNLRERVLGMHAFQHRGFRRYQAVLVAQKLMKVT